MNSLDEETGTIVDLQVRPFIEVKKGYTYLGEGDVLFAKITPCMQNGKASIARGLTDGLGFGSTEFHVLRPRDGVLSEWIFYFVRQERFREEAQKRFRGAVGQQRVPQEFLKEYSIPVPSTTEEQRRIVAKIEALFDRIREAKRLRIEAQKDATQFLNTALEQVLDKVYSDSPQVERLGELATAFNGRASGSGETRVRVFKTKHVYPFDLKQEDPSHMRQDQIGKYPQDRFLRPGDVLVCNIARGTLGRVCYVDHAEENWAVDTQIMILRTQKKCLGKWLFYFLYSKRGQAEIFAREKGIAFADKRGQTHLYPRDMLTVPIPLPSMSEQRTIVAYLDEAYNGSAALKQRQQETDAELKRLEQSILDRAFRGEL